jgi:hypothetical protein
MTVSPAIVLSLPTGVRASADIAAPSTYCPVHPWRVVGRSQASMQRNLFGAALGFFGLNEGEWQSSCCALRSVLLPMLGVVDAYLLIDAIGNSLQLI